MSPLEAGRGKKQGGSLRKLGPAGCSSSSADGRRWWQWREVLILEHSEGDTAGVGCGTTENERSQEEANIQGLSHWDSGSGLLRRGAWRRRGGGVWDTFGLKCVSDMGTW